MQSQLQLRADQLFATGLLESQVDNSWFLPIELFDEAHQILALSIYISETLMDSNLQNIEVNGKSIGVFPAVEFRLTSHNGDLIPLDRDLLRNPQGRSYWDFTLSPGKVWTETGDDGWSRAALPFQLTSNFENDSHHGIATFLYNCTEISPIFFQIVAETKAFLCPDNLQAWGWLKRCSVLLNADDLSGAVDAYQGEIHDSLPIKSLGGWQSGDTSLCIKDIEQGFGSESTIVSGLVVDDFIYTTPCQTSMGDYPYPRAMKFGIWSATKTAFCTVAYLWLGQVLGEDPRDAELTSLFPETKGNTNWDGITIGHCLDMATGIGTAAPDYTQPNIFGDYLIEDWQSQESEEALQTYNRYHDWLLAPSQHEKNLAAFACPSYPWPAGTITRYRDQDLYIAGVALDALLKMYRGSDARLWDMVRDEVYIPARIHHAVKFHTVESDVDSEVPLSDAGLLLTMDNIARLGKLILDRGKIEGQQILEPQLLHEIFSFDIEKGLPTGTYTADGEVHYYASTWYLPYQTRSEEKFWIPTMRGYGGQLIQILPNNTIGFRFGFDSYETEERYDALKLARLSDTIRPF